VPLRGREMREGFSTMRTAGMWRIEARAHGRPLFAARPSELCLKIGEAHS
jgi:hypothetical protein